MAPGSPSKSRVTSVDAWRGLVMIIMALDHVRDFFHASAQAFQPDNLAKTTTALFLTRWITHFCAPVFMFTAGISAFFWLRRGHTRGELSAFLWKRGAWLILLDATLMQAALGSKVIVLTVLWALGWSMIALAFLAHLPARLLAIVSVAVIALHNLADPIPAAHFGSLAWGWNVLHQSGVARIGGTTFLFGYPLIPWFAVMSAGFCFGSVMTLPAGERRRWLTRAGVALTLAFLIIRGINIYGDPAPWSTRFPGMTVLSFLRCTKYPPSLDFLLMTLGPALLVLSWFDRLSFSETNPLIVFGRVPFFYFILHLFVAFLLGTYVVPKTPHLAVVYAWWLGIVAALYPLCLWYMRLKKRRNSWWLSYL